MDLKMFFRKAIATVLTWALVLALTALRMREI